VLFVRQRIIFTLLLPTANNIPSHTATISVNEDDSSDTDIDGDIVGLVEPPVSMQAANVKGPGTASTTEHWSRCQTAAEQASSSPMSFADFVNHVPLMNTMTITCRSQMTPKNSGELKH